jgi:hypothetical protein
MCKDEAKTLTFETLLDDPLAHMMMESDGVTRAELAAVLEKARAAIAAREVAAMRSRIAA